jgi:hypothetical protein
MTEETPITPLDYLDQAKQSLIAAINTDARKEANSDGQGSVRISRRNSCDSLQ